MGAMVGFLLPNKSSQFIPRDTSDEPAGVALVEMDKMRDLGEQKRRKTREEKRGREEGENEEERGIMTR